MKENNSFPLRTVYLLLPIEKWTLLLLTHHIADAQPCIFRCFMICFRYQSPDCVLQTASLLNLNFVVIAAASRPLLTFDLNKTYLAKGGFDWQLHYKMDVPPSGFHHETLLSNLNVANPSSHWIGGRITGPLWPDTPFTPTPGGGGHHVTETCGTVALHLMSWRTYVETYETAPRVILPCFVQFQHEWTMLSKHM